MMRALCCAVFSLAWQCCPALRSTRRKDQKKHVVLVVFDDLGWADVGFHGSNFPTPALDKLATEGVQLDRMYVMPTCSPSRAAIMTGRFSFRMGLHHPTTITPGGPAGIPASVKTLAETFKAGGYATHMVGKWHLGALTWEQTPTGRGFDSFLGLVGGKHDYYKHTFDSSRSYKRNENRKSPYGPNGAALDFFQDRKPLKTAGVYTADVFEQRLETILRPYGQSSALQPMFLYWADLFVHNPLQAPPESKYLEACRGVRGGSAKGNRTILCSMANRLDHAIDVMVQKLKKYGMWQNTLLFALSDNGGMPNIGDSIESNSAASNFPLRGTKTSLFEGGVRSVAFVSGGALPTRARGTRRSTLLHAVDILPTLAAFAGVDLLGRSDGLDAWSAIVGGSPISRTELPLAINKNPITGFSFSDSGPVGELNSCALISWPWKVILGAAYTGKRRLDSWWKLENYTEEKSTEPEVLPARLFNLETDEEERINLANKAEHQKRLEQLIGRIKWYGEEKNGYVEKQENMPIRSENPSKNKWIMGPHS